MFLKTRLPVEQANFYHLVMDIAWFGIALPATLRFLSVYAIRLGATALELSLLTALPALGLFLSSNMSEWWRRRHPDSVQALAIPAFLFRFVFLLPAFTPFMPENLQRPYLILAVTLPSIPQGIAGIMFLVMIRESIAMPDITRLFSRREMAMNVALSIAALGFGFWLEKIPFPYNYQTMYVAAFLFTMISWRHCNQVRSLTVVPHKADDNSPAASPWRSPQFVRVAGVLVITHIAYYGVFPLVPLHLVNGLKATEGFIALFSVAELSSAALLSTFAARIANRLGTQTMIGIAMIGTAGGSLIVAVSPVLPLTLFAAVILGSSWSMVTIARFAFFSEHTPAEHVGRYTTAYNQTIAIASFIGPMLGSFLMDMELGLVNVLIIGAGGRLAAGLLTLKSADVPAPIRLRLKFR